MPYRGISKKKRYALFLGRICPEKNVETAIDAAKKAGIALGIAGQVFPHETHLQYYDYEVLPRLDKHRRILAPVPPLEKNRLLGSAQCLLVPSLIAETSSLVAMEALANATPVIAFPAGALPEIVEHGKTGFIVNNSGEMAEAISAVKAIEPEKCREAARRRFNVERMIQLYFERYAQLAGRRIPDV